jgi:hypothetical protein
VDVHWEMTGAMDAQGISGPIVRVCRIRDGEECRQWQILVMHNLDLTALPPSNSGNRQ